jgi:RNA polymerase sigma-70 factor (ECF subfamily)
MEKQVEAIWYEFSAVLKRFILKRVGDEQVADDILQEVFIKVHRHLDTLEDDARLESWLYQITRNAITDFYRHSPAFTALDDDTPFTEQDDEDELQVALAVSVRGMMDLLPEPDRTALILDSLAGIPQAEIGARMGLSVSGAKSRVQRARAKLRGLLFDCCHFEFDRRGQVIDYHPRANCCAQCNCATDSVSCAS